VVALAAAAAAAEGAAGVEMYGSTIALLSDAPLAPEYEDT